MQIEFVIAGFGGQGVMFAGQLLAYAGLVADLEVTWIPSYGPEMRGGTANCTVVISDRPIGSPLVGRPQVGLVFNKPSFDKYEPIVSVGGVLVRNASLIHVSSTRLDLTELGIPATETASELGDLRLANMVMIGAALAARPVLTLEVFEKALAQHLPAHRRNLLPANIAALEAGLKQAQKLLVSASGRKVSSVIS